MNLKKIAQKGLIVLAVVVALCMFFARTILTLTTPKVSLAQPQMNARLEQRLSLDAQVHFPGAVPFIYRQAADYQMAVDRVYIRPGYPVKTGDLLFTLSMTDYDQKLEELSEKYDAEVIKLAEEDIKSRKARGNDNEQNRRYEAMIALQGAAADARMQARAQFMEAGIELPGDIALWPEAAGDDATLKKSAQQALESQLESDEAADLFFDSYSDNKVRVSSNLFEYLQKRAVIVRGMEKIESDMAQMTAVQSALAEVRAERDGIIVEVAVKEGEAYDGKKMAYSMDDPEKPPVLRADASAITRAIQPGSKAVIKGERYEEWTTQVSAAGVDLAGKRYVDMALEDEDSSPFGGLYTMVMRGSASSFTAEITYRSNQSATLIPASALHTDDGDYIFVLERNRWGGFMDSGMKARKKDVTVVDKSDRMVAVAEDMYNEEIIYREDRPLQDGDAVMEYIN